MQKHDFHVLNHDPANAQADLDNAVQENDISLLCDPNFLGAWASRADIAIMQGKLDEARKCVERMISIDPHAPETLQEERIMANRHLELNHADEAIGWLSRILESNPLVEVYYARGSLYLQKGDWIHAQQDLAKVAHDFPQFPGVQDKLREIQRQLEKTQK